MTEPIVGEVLASRRGRSAVAAGDTGAVIKLVRTALGLRQSDLGALIGYSQSTICRLEKGQGRANDITVLATLSRHLDIPPAALGLAGSPRLAVEGMDDVKRQDFLRGLAGAAAVLALPPVLTDDTRRVGIADVRACRDALTRLYELDGQVGGGAIYNMTEQMIRRLRRLLDVATHSPVTRHSLREILSAASEHAGWLAFDAGRHDQSRKWYLEALHAADLGGHAGVRTTALASMSLQAADRGHGAQAVELAEAACRAMTPTPRLLSLLKAREALGHAARGDRAASSRMFAKANNLLDRGDHADDPIWLAFWGPADLACHESKAAMLLGDHALAEQAARRTVSTAEADGRGLERNRILYAVRLGNVLVRRRAIEEAMHVMTPAVAKAASISSDRVRAELGAGVSLLAGRRDYVPARAFAAWANRMLQGV
jgi:transcriptional regulator with XRE-family HTH domain